MLLPERFREKHKEHRKGYMSEPRTRPMGTGLELYGRKKDGSEFPVDIALGPLQAAKEIVVLAVIRDFSELKIAEEKLGRAFAELRRSNKDLEEFAYGVSHDLKEPLRKISSFIELLAKRFKGKLGDETDRYIHYIVDGAERMLVLINDVLTYSRVGTVTKLFVPIDCNELVKQVLSDMQQKIGSAGAAVTVDPLPVVTADKTELTRVFQNLVDNAVKFRREEPLRVHISVNRDANEWIFSISDNGIGIAKEFLDRIFVVFQRLHTREEYGGTGIGLAICKKAVERHGGRIWAGSENGKGSTFYFTIPDAARGE
jgi:light-regulated signal transduction histidine kinase (bacteriophytochrome)